MVILSKFKRFFLSVGFLCFLTIPQGEAIAAHPADTTEAPRLVIVIIVDQMRSDFLPRFQDLYSGGFRQLLSQGAVFSQSSYPYSGSVTGPGHASALSGRLPSATGIVDNGWFDRTLGRVVNSVEDTSTTAVGVAPETKAGKRSYRWFLGEAFGDILKAERPGAKVIALDIKDRAAILTAGRHPDGAYWFDAASGNFITSSYYHRTLPGWVSAFNSRKIPETYIGKTWSKLLPEEAYQRSGKDSAAGEGTLYGETAPVFPHTVADIPPGSDPHANRYDPIIPTPYGSELTIAFARAAIAGERLGDDDVTDLLALNIASPDYCGHTFGPQSHEAQDMMLRLDAQLERFFAFIDSTIGVDRTLFVLTSDHGCCPIPEQTADRGGRRVSSEHLLAAARTAVAGAFDYDETAERLIHTFAYDYLYLDSARIRARGISTEKFAHTIVTALRQDPDVAACYTRAELLAAADASQSDSILERVRNSFHPGRSGDIAVVLKPYRLWSQSATGTGHGSPYWYDRAVPLVFYGFGINSGIFERNSTPLDIVPTVSKILGMERLPDGCTGTLLKEAIKNVR